MQWLSLLQTRALDQDFMAFLESLQRFPWPAGRSLSHSRKIVKRMTDIELTDSVRR
jgi:hypothetical protein